MRKIVLFGIAWLIFSLPHSVQADARVLSYSAATGKGATARIGSVGNYTFVRGIPGFATGWSHIVGL